MRKPSWLFKKLNLSLRTEVIINISLLMLVAIFLIGFTTFRANERNIIQAKIRHAEEMVQDFQRSIDFILLERAERALHVPSAQNGIQNFLQVYRKGRKFNQLVITDQEGRVIASQELEQVDQITNLPLLRRAIQTGSPQSEIEKSEGIFSSEYKKVAIASPLWFKGKIAGGLLMEVSTDDVMRHLLLSLIHI